MRPAIYNIWKVFKKSKFSKNIEINLQFLIGILEYPLINNEAGYQLPKVSIWDNIL